MTGVLGTLGAAFSAIPKLETAIWTAVISGVFGFGRLLWLRGEERARTKAAIIGELQSLLMHYKLTHYRMKNGEPNAPRSLRLKLAIVGERMFLKAGYLEKAGISNAQIMAILQIVTLMRNNDIVVQGVLELLEATTSVGSTLRESESRREYDVADLIDTLRVRFDATQRSIEYILKKFGGPFGWLLVRTAKDVVAVYGGVEKGPLGNYGHVPDF